MAPDPKPVKGATTFEPDDLRKEILRQDINEIQQNNSSTGEQLEELELLQKELRELESKQNFDDNSSSATSDPSSAPAEEQLKALQKQLKRLKQLQKSNDEQENSERRAAQRILERDEIEQKRKIEHQKAEQKHPEKPDALEIDLHYDFLKNGFRALRDEWDVFTIQYNGHMRKAVWHGPTHFAEHLKKKQEAMTLMEMKLTYMHSARLSLKRAERIFMLNAFRKRTLSYNILMLQKKRQFLISTWPTRRALFLIRPMKAMLSTICKNIKSL